MSRMDSDQVVRGVHQRRPRAAHLGPAARRPLVLDAALEVWNELGPRGVTMAAIAAQAGVSKPVLYECFDNKDAVLLALLEREEERLMSGALAAVPTSFGPPHEVARAAYQSFFESVVQHPLSWRVVFDAQRPTSSDVPDVVSRRYIAARTMVLQQVAALFEAGELAPGFHGAAEFLVVAEHAVSLAEANGRLLLQDQDTWRPDTLADVVARLLLNGISGPASAP